MTNQYINDHAYVISEMPWGTFSDHAQLLCPGSLRNESRGHIPAHFGRLATVGHGSRHWWSPCEVLINAKRRQKILDQHCALYEIKLRSYSLDSQWHDKHASPFICFLSLSPSFSRQHRPAVFCSHLKHLALIRRLPLEALASPRQKAWPPCPFCFASHPLEV